MRKVFLFCCCCMLGCGTLISNTAYWKTDLKPQLRIWDVNTEAYSGLKFAKIYFVVSNPTNVKRLVRVKCHDTFNRSIKEQKVMYVQPKSDKYDHFILVKFPNPENKVGFTCSLENLVTLKNLLKINKF